MPAGSASLVSVTEINRLDEDGFVALLGPVFEHSPWVARAAWSRRPFADLVDAHRALEGAVREAPEEERLALIRAHPELAGREAQEGELTAESSREQASAGLDRLSAAEAEALRHLNLAYRERFGFPLIVCVRERAKDSILTWGTERLAHRRDQEVDVALGEILKIARLRLEEVVSDGQ